MGNPSRGRVHVRGRGGRGHFRIRSFKSNINNKTSTGSHQKEIRLSPQSQVKQPPSYDTLRYAFIHHIKNAMVKGAKM